MSSIIPRSRTQSMPVRGLGGQQSCGKMLNGWLDTINPSRDKACTRKCMHAETLALLNSKHEVLSW